MQTAVMLPAPSFCLRAARYKNLPCEFTHNCFSVQLDEVMGTANAVAGRVGEQSRIFENIGNKVLAVGAKFPAINGIINAVRRKKSKVSNAMQKTVS